MKLFKYMLVLPLAVLFMHSPAYSQVIRISGGANLVISGNARLVLHNENIANGGSVGANTSVTFTGYSEKAAMLSQKNSPVISNIMVDKSYGNAWATADNIYLFIGKESLPANLLTFQTFMRAWPNPTTERLTLSVSSDKAMEGVIALQDASGKTLERKRINYTTGINTITWNMGGYAPGTYVLVFENAPGRYMKIVRQ